MKYCYNNINMSNNPFWNFVYNHYYVKWDWSILVENPNVDWETICSASSTLFKCKHQISRNTSITTKLIKENRFMFDSYKIVANENYTIDANEFNLALISNNHYYFINPNILPHLVELYKKNNTKVIKFTNNLNYNVALSSNPGVTWELINYMKIYWRYKVLSRHQNITWEIVQANPDKPWDYCFLSSNPNITWEIIQANPDKKWNYTILLQNPNITPKIIMNNINKFKYFQKYNIHHFHHNKLNYHPYFHSANYKRKMTAQLHATIYCELIQRACTPARLYQWNEFAAEQFPKEYARECLKYK